MRQAKEMGSSILHHPPASPTIEQVVAFSPSRLVVRRAWRTIAGALASVFKHDITEHDTGVHIYLAGQTSRDL